MARRQLLSNEAWAARLAPAVDDREVIRHYTLSEDDFDVIMRGAGTFSRTLKVRKGNYGTDCLSTRVNAPLSDP